MASNKLEVQTPKYFVDFYVDMNHFIGLQFFFESQHWTFYASNSLTIKSFRMYVCNLCKKYGQQQLQAILVIWHISLCT
jgi:hypothetical protein